MMTWNGSEWGSASAAAATWGSITGTISSQSDLITALNLKANLASLAPVALSGIYSDLTGKPTNLSQFTNDTNFITSAQAPVQSVASKVGVVTLNSSDVGLANVNNTSDANKPISSATQTALNLKYDASNPSSYITASGAPVQSVFSRVGAIAAQSGDYSTAQVTEGTNLYYTQSRFDSAFSAKSTTNLNEGTNLYYTQGRFDSAFSAKSTSNLAEGSNLYFTSARAQSAISVSSPLTYSLGVIGCQSSSGSQAGCLSSTDWSTFNSKQSSLTLGNLTETGTDGISVTGGSGAVVGSGTSLSQHVADTTHNGYLLASDWNTFSSKEPAITAGTTLQYWRGDKSFQTLNTGAVPESSNLYFTNARAQSAVSASSPLVDTAGVFSIPPATAIANGYLSSSDWNTFNNKLDKSESNYITNPDFETNTTGWNLYNDSGNPIAASVTMQDITYTSTLSGGSGNGATISYTLCGSSYVGPIVTCPTGTSVQVCWYNGPTISQNPTATVLKAAYDAQSCATAIASSAITGTASKLQYETGTSTLSGGGDTSPVDGTGGSPSGVTITRNTLTPLVGTASGDLGKIASSKLGQGVSTDFVINAIDKNQILQLSFAYEGSSSMVLGSSSDVQVFVYDIGNSVLIPVTPRRTITGPVSTPKTFVGTFPSSSSSNYRLILHIATSSASAWDLLLDSVTVNDQVDQAVATQVPSVVLKSNPISGAVTDHMVVMWIDGAAQWVPATIAGAALPVFGDDKTQLGFATNIVGSVADIYIKGYMGGFSFGPFLGFEQYIDNTAGGISPLPSPFNDMYVMVGMAISATELNIQFDTHVDQIQNGSGLPLKGGLLTSSAVNDGTGDVVLSPGANGTFLVANSAVAKGLNWRVLAAGDVPTLNQSTTGSAATWTTARNLAGNSVNGSANVAFANKFLVQGTTDAGLSGAQFMGALGTGIVKNTTTTGVESIAVAADFPTLNQNTTGSAATLTTARTIAGTSFNGSANITLANKFIVQGTSDAGLSGPQFLGALATGLIKNTTTTGVLSAAAASDVTGQLLTGYVSGAGTVAATDSLLQGIQKLNGNAALFAPLASPTFTGTVTLPASSLINGASAGTNTVVVYKDGHIKNTQTTAATASVGTPAGTGATCTLTGGTDSSGSINLTTTATLPTSGIVCTVNFNKAYGVAPHCVTTAISSGAIVNEVTSGVFFSTTTAGLKINFANSDVTGHTYNYDYYCVETQ